MNAPPAFMPAEPQYGRGFARALGDGRVARPTPRPAARTSQSRHANPTPASCGLGLGRPDTGQLVLRRPCGPPESRVTGGILPPSARARWTTREPGILARLPSNSGKDAPLRGCDVARAPVPARFLRASAQKGDRVAYFFMEGFVGDGSLRGGVTLVLGKLGREARRRSHGNVGLDRTSPTDTSLREGDSHAV